MGRTTRPRADFAIHRDRRGFTSKTIDAERDRYFEADLALTKRIAAVLEFHYPAHPWQVEVSHEKGCVFISLPVVMKRNEKFVLHTEALKTDPALRSVMRGAGEILERYNMPRMGFKLDDFLAARDRGPFGRRQPPKLILG